MSDKFSKYQDSPKRILMLVPHEPDLDPRIKWVTQLCSQIGRTDILGFVYETKKPIRKYDGRIFTERIISENYFSPHSPYFYWYKIISYFKIIQSPHQFFPRIYNKLLRNAYLLLNRTYIGRKIWGTGKFLITRLHPRSILPKNQNLQNSEGQSSPDISQESQLQNEKLPAEKNIKKTNDSKTIPQNDQPKVKKINSIAHIVNLLNVLDVISYELFQHGRAVSIIPKVIICHDIYALKAAVKLKKLFGSPVIYDSHELWPEAILDAKNWEKFIIKLIERKLIRKADVVITVTPQIARYLEHLYGISNVISVPNAEPLTGRTFNNHPQEYPIRFLLQGQMAPGRGVEKFLDAWSMLKNDKAILIMRCPENPFFDYLKQRFNFLIQDGRIIIAPAVSEDELISAASAADVGIIPYTGPNLNHVYACPNKLSQYMQAGLAILHNSDEEFVSEIISRYQCGLAYDSNHPDTLIAAVDYISNNPEQLNIMKCNAYRAAQEEFNWEQQSKKYFNAIKSLFEK
jgi:glycosyltransferase involved in cell wall biosynthesis